MAECFKCGKSSEEVKLLDAIFNDELVKICEECSLSEDIPIIRRPTTSQLKESERSYSVRERLRRMAGLVPEEREKAIEIAKKIMTGKVPTIAELQKRKTRQEMIEEEYELAKKRNVPLNLIDNFNWYIFMARRKKKLTRKELADFLGESETAIKMIENKQFPDDADILIRKIEQFFNLKLRKEETKEEEKIKKVEEKAEKVEKKEEVEEKKEKAEEKIEEKTEEPARVLQFNKESINNLTIADLQEMKKEKGDIARLERQKKMQVNDLLVEVEKEEEIKEEERWKKEANRDLLGNDIDLVD